MLYKLEYVGSMRSATIDATTTDWCQHSDKE